MCNYTRVALATLQAEFPSFQLMNALHVFDASGSDKSLYGSKQEGQALAP